MNPDRSRPIRCVHFLRRVSFADGGVTRAVLDICSGMAQLGHEMTLLTSDPQSVPTNWTKSCPKTPRVVVTPLPAMLKRLPQESQRALANADVLHLHGPWEYPCLPLAKHALQRNLPYIVSTHANLNTWIMKQKPLKKRLYLAVVGRRYLSKAAAVHCTAAAELSQVTKYLKKDNGLVARLPIDLSPYETLPGPEYALRAFPQLDPTVPKILYLSRLHPMKRPDLLLESAALVRESQQRFQMVLAGPGDPKYLSFLHDLVRRLHLENNVVFTGLVTGKIKVSLYQTARAFVLPTWQENFGYVYFEALASGTPVITTRGADMWRDLEQAGATVVEPDASKIASALAGLIASPDQAKLIGDAGRRWVFETFGTKKAFDDLIRIYDDVIQRSAA